MGGIIGSSKIDPYVLRIEESATTRQEVLSNRRKSLAENRFPSGNLNSSTLDIVQSEPTVPTASNSVGKLVRAGSLKMPAVGSSSGSSSSSSSSSRKAQTTVAVGRMKMSSGFPWLIKDADCERPKLSCDQIDFKKVVGYGLMGIVRIAKLKDQNAFFAVKSIRKDYVKRHNDGRHIANEREILMKLRLTGNPFCIKLFGTFQDTKNVYFAMELAAGGELFRRLCKKENFSPEVSKFYTIEIMSALEHIHSIGYVYRDLKPGKLPPPI